MLNFIQTLAFIKMEPGLHISDSKILYKPQPISEIGIVNHCRSFRIPLNDVKLIAVSPRMNLDDEQLYFLFIDLNRNLYPVPFEDFATCKELHKHFEIEELSQLWEKFEHEQFYGTVDKILYPKEHYWQDLFKQNWKIKIRSLYSWIIPKSFLGDKNAS